MKIRPLTHNRYGRYLFFYARRWKLLKCRRVKKAAAEFDARCIAEGLMESTFQPPPWR